jgi:hypothetical protein
MQESGCLQDFTHGYASPSYTLVLCWLLWVAVVLLMMLLVELDHWLLVLALLLPVACPAPPCAWLPTLPALHLLGAWHAPCCFCSWLSNHVALALAMVLDWWGEFPPDAQLMSRENLCYAGASVVLWYCGAVVAVLWCYGCYGAVLWCWLTRVFGRPVLHSQDCFISPPGFWWLDTSLTCIWWPAACLLGGLAGQIG